MWFNNQYVKNKYGLNTKVNNSTKEVGWGGIWSCRHNTYQVTN